MDFLSVFSPEISSLTGELSLQALLSGSLETPLIYGDLTLDQGSVVSSRDIADLSNITTKLKLQGDRGIIIGRMNVGQVSCYWMAD